MLIAEQGPYMLMVRPDDIAISPREVDEHFGTMVCFHPRYALGDSHNYMDKTLHLNPSNQLRCPRRRSPDGR